jgi:hypothetical protein
MSMATWRSGLMVAAIAALGSGCIGRSVDSASQEGQGDDLQPLQLSGAIWTTDESGQRVDQNLYEMPCDVYLNGGPMKEGAAGLPEGDYYFQITEPSASDNDPEGGPSRLLTTDDIGFRQFHVGANGEIDGVSGDGNRPTATNADTGEVMIRLCPYLQSENPGCVHKVWVTPVADYVADEAAVDAPPNTTFGFRLNRSKTDNFKVCAGDEGEGEDDAESGDATAP